MKVYQSTHFSREKQNKCTAGFFAFNSYLYRVFQKKVPILKTPLFGESMPELGHWVRYGITLWFNFEATYDMKLPTLFCDKLRYNTEI